MSKPKLSLASLSVNAQPPADHMDKEPIQSNKDIKTSKHQDTKIADKVQVAFRMSPDAHKDLRRMAIDDGTTVNALLLQGINLLRKQKGLRPLDD
ncbi:MAG TPA: hypothetical protein DEX10_00445 [Betaproteobacteria bacterium]|jgi:hypothetical protein|nr:hypothetical protein [Betaproteobacteria bacterium]